MVHLKDFGNLKPTEFERDADDFMQLIGAAMHLAPRLDADARDTVTRSLEAVRAAADKALAAIKE